MENHNDIKIEQHWDIKILNDNPLYPALVIDNWYTPNEEKAIWKELDFYTATPKDKILRAEQGSVVARDEKGNPRSKAFRFYLNTYYNSQSIDNGISPIFNCCYKQRAPEFHKIIEDNFNPYARSFNCSNGDTHLISYYEDNDYYAPHYDIFAWTMCIWFVREPRKFTGGDFIFNESETEIKLKHNRMLFFPSCLLHQVTPIKFKEPTDEIGHGKFTITHWYYSTPNGNPRENK